MKIFVRSLADLRDDGTGTSVTTCNMEYTPCNNSLEVINGWLRPQTKIGDLCTMGELGLQSYHNLIFRMSSSQVYKYARWARKTMNKNQNKSEKQCMKKSEYISKEIEIITRNQTDDDNLGRNKNQLFSLDNYMWADSVSSNYFRTQKSIIRLAVSRGRKAWLINCG